MTLFDVLRELVHGNGSVLNDATWVREALAAIDKHEAGPEPEPEAAPPAPAPVAPRPRPLGGNL